MRVGFDVSACAAPHSLGVRRVAGSLVAALEERGVIEVVRLAPPAGAGLFRWRQRGLPAAVAEQGLVGVHSFTSSFALLGKGKRVQTIHELPWRHGAGENAGWRHRFWARVGPLRADRVVCPTEHVAEDLGRPGCVRVIPWGVDRSFSPEPPAGCVDELILKRYRLREDPLVFCPGAVRAKKNLAAVIRGVAELKEQGGPRVELVVTGGDTVDLRRDLGLAQRLGIGPWITTLDTVDEGDLAPLLRLSAVVPVLSISEGFGLTVLEALASGTPVLVPPASAQAEVAGKEGIHVDPERPASVAEALRDVLIRREQLRAQLPARAAAFTWERAARSIEELWSELA